MKKIVIIGGGAAGAKAAAKTKRTDSSNYVQLYCESDEIAFSLCGLPYFIEGSVDDINKLTVKTKEDFLKNGIEVFLNHKLQAIYPNENCILINGNKIFYDVLVLALGAIPYVPQVENCNAGNIFTLRKLDDAIKIKDKMRNSKSVLVMGGGYIAVELCEAFLKNGLNVIILEKNSELIHDFDKDFSSLFYKHIKDISGNNLQIYFNETILKFNVDTDNNFTSIETKSGKVIEADFCVVATGSLPNIETAQKAGIEIGQTGAINVDNKLRTNIPNIFACGDCCQKYCLITKQPVYVGLGTVANKEGRVVGINAAKNDYFETFDGVLKSKIAKFYDYTISKTGLTMKEALDYSNIINIEPVCTTITKKDMASYMPNGENLVFKLVADKRSSEILGAQAFGRFGKIAQRINTIATVLKSRMTVDDLIYLDLPYAPPYSTSIDPILTAAYKLKDISDK